MKTDREIVAEVRQWFHETPGSQFEDALMKAVLLTRIYIHPVPAPAPAPTKPAIDWDHWRRVYAGQAMQALLTCQVTDVDDIISKAACWAVELVEELKKWEGKE